MALYQFWIDVHAEPPLNLARGQADLDGREFETLIAPPGSAGTPLGASFEQACTALGRLEQLHIEPDGAFVWRWGRGQPSWQVDGVLYDRAQQLIYVELKGKCPAAQFDQLLSAFGWPETRLMFQLVREGAFVDEINFRRYALMARFD